MVAIEATGQPADARIGEFAAASGLSAYDARTRLQAAMAAPAVLACFADPVAARALHDRLDAARFSPIVLSSPIVESRVDVSTFRLRDDRFVVEGGSMRFEIELGGVGLLLLGTRFSEHQRYKPREHRISWRGGGMELPGSFWEMPSRTEIQRKADRFMHVYLPGTPALALDESKLKFIPSTDGALAVTRAENFARLVSELRSRCPRARYDDRLRTRGSQARILGAGLRPESHLDVAIALLARGATEYDPYR